ncbi:unnamed protein product [Schistocephalus solidus]|uniref:Uncharacterized protein n=1 Tax=Schistocephalus solidus TaxID=70667 RepID=A0A183SIM5_SCHSO|nr:unnamed protein product [Schistocephalus solidus]
MSFRLPLQGENFATIIIAYAPTMTSCDVAKENSTRTCATSWRLCRRRTSLLSLVTSTPASGQTTLPGKESWIPTVSVAITITVSFFCKPVQYTVSCCQHLFPSYDEGEGHVDAPSVAALAAPGLCSRPEARWTGRAGNQGDPRCQWLDGKPPAHHQPR